MDTADKKVPKLLQCVLLFLLYLQAFSVSAAEVEIKTENTEVLYGNRFLVVTPDPDVSREFSSIFLELYGAEVTYKDFGQYRPVIDEVVFDAFIYHGVSYYEEPPAGFINDMERTIKPVLWLNYHGWLLDKKYLGDIGLVIHDLQNDTFNEIELQDVFPLENADTTLFETDPKNVIYWLRSPSAGRTPGGVLLGNYAFVTHLPSLDIFSTDFFPFLEVVKAVFGTNPAPTSTEIPGFKQRIANARADSFRTGVHLPVYAASSDNWLLGYEDDQWHENLVRIKQAGAEWVNLVRTYYQTSVYSSDVGVDAKYTPSLESLENIVRDAHDLGLLVQLHVAINLKEPLENDWHGVISPKSSDQWWAAYRALLLEIAEFSSNNEIEALIIGTELSYLQKYEEEWREGIKSIREKTGYPGMLGYGANYNALNVPWVDALDLFGISAYWPLSEDRDPAPETLNKSWQKVHQELVVWREKHPNTRIEFTEVGYASQPYSSVLPFSWKPHKGRAQSFSEQFDTYRALYRFLSSHPYIKGVHIFASNEEDDDSESNGYTPFGKPAEEVLKQIVQIR